MLVWTMIGFYVLGLANIGLGWARLTTFAKDHRSLDRVEDMVAYKKAVAMQMYLAIVQIGLLAAPVVLYFYGVATGRLGFMGLVVVLLMSLVVIGLARAVKSTEQQIKAIPCATPELAAERERVVQTWQRKPFPDW